jgi:phage gp46-like protein
MTDIAILWQQDFHGDFEIADTGDDLKTDDGLQTAIFISLWTDRRVNEDETLPFGETDRRGYFGDNYADVPGDQIGSRLWTLDRAKQMQQSMIDARTYCEEALQWLKDDGVCDSFTVEVTNPEFQTWIITVKIYKPDTDPATYKYNYNWQEQTAHPVK